ncbi:MAG: GspH/FimT family pseudopilin [Stenotrophobium sp.]
MQSHGAGFTLLELLVTIMVVAIGAAVAVPSFTHVLGNSRLAAYTNELSTALALARSEAVKRNLPVGLCRSANATASVPSCVSGTGTGGWEIGWIVFADVDHDGKYDNDKGDIVLHRRGALSGGVTVTGANNVTNRLVFTARGILPAGMVSFTFKDGRTGGVRMICLPVTGRVRVAIPKNSETPSCA